MCLGNTDQLRSSPCSAGHLHSQYLNHGKRLCLIDWLAAALTDHINKLTRGGVN